MQQLAEIRVWIRKEGKIARAKLAYRRIVREAMEHHNSYVAVAIAGCYCTAAEVRTSPDRGTLETKGDPGIGLSAPDVSIVNPTIASVVGKIRLLTRVA